MNQSYLILADSGGVQEEAPSLGKPVLVMRNTTERPEGIEAGIARLVGTSSRTIFDGAASLLENVGLYAQMARTTNPYGDCKASKRICGCHILGIEFIKNRALVL
jgi:UDP-N-acetylglucosamine 2-epimerase (non-hydrolysing)